MRAIFPITIALTRPTGPAIMYVLYSMTALMKVLNPASLVLLTGFPYFIAIINLPQRFQIVNGDSPIMAGVHLMPLLCAMALGGSLIQQLLESS